MKQSNTKKSLTFSAWALLISILMLIGTTFAWFTDSVTSGKNIIASGNLDVAMYYADGTKPVPAADAINAKGEASDEKWTDASEAAIFDYDLWEPGYTDVKHIMIANEGTLALVYKLELQATGSVSELANVLDVYVVQPTEETTDLQRMATQIATRADMSKMTKLCTLSELFANGGTIDLSGKMLAGENNTLTIAIKMQEEAGNEYRELELGSDVKVVLKAFQYTYEKDAFDNQYDKDAIPGVNPEEKEPEATVSNTAELTQAIAKSTNDEIVLSVTGEVSLKDVDFGGKNIVLVGGEGGSLVDVGNGTKGAPNAIITMKNMTVQIAHTPGMSYTQGIQHAKQERYIGCTFEGQLSTMTPDVYYENCKFKGSSSDEYTLWVYAGKIEAKNCEFKASKKGIIKLYAESGNNADISFTGCTFHNSGASKGAIFASNTNSVSNISGNEPSDYIYNGTNYKVVGTDCIFDDNANICKQGGTTSYENHCLVLSDISINGTSYKDVSYVETSKGVVVYFPDTKTIQKIE